MKKPYLLQNSDSSKIKLKLFWQGDDCWWKVKYIRDLSYFIKMLGNSSNTELGLHLYLWQLHGIKSLVECVYWSSVS